MTTAANIEMLDLEGYEVKEITENADKNYSRWVAFGVGVLIIGLVILFLADRMFHPDKFQITEIMVQGDFDNVDGEQVKRVVQGALDGNYFSVSLQRMEKEIAELPWVFNSSLRRRWPSTIIVDVVEVQPVALWGQSQWLNFTGDLIEMELDGSGNGYEDLPRLSGPEGSAEAVWRAFRNWSGRFASSGLSLNGLKLEGSGLWFLDLSLGALVLSKDAEGLFAGNTTHSGITMIVEGEQPTAAISRFIRTLNQHLITRFPEMLSVDLRYPNGFAIRWREDVQPDRQDESASVFGAVTDTGNNIE